MLKKVLSIVLMTAVIVTSLVFAPQSAAEVQAATKPYFIAKNPVLTYKTGDAYSRYYTMLSIAGCTKKSEIKNLKSSNKKVQVEAKDGYVVAYFGDKALTSTISCKVNGTKISTKLTIKKYSNPFSTFKIGSANFTSKFNKDDEYRQKKDFKKQTLNIKVKKDWIITSVSVYSDGSSNTYRVNKSSFSKKITLSGKYSATIYVYVKNAKTGVSEHMIFQKSNY